MVRRPPRSTLERSSAASDVYKRQPYDLLEDARFRRDAEAIFSQGRGGGLVRARVAAINAEFGPAGALSLIPISEPTRPY